MILLLPSLVKYFHTHWNIQMQIDQQLLASSYICENHHSLLGPPVDMQGEGPTDGNIEVILVIFNNVIQVCDVSLSQ